MPSCSRNAADCSGGAEVQRNMVAVRHPLVQLSYYRHISERRKAKGLDWQVCSAAVKTLAGRLTCTRQGRRAARSRITGHDQRRTGHGERAAPAAVEAPAGFARRLSRRAPGRRRRSSPPALCLQCSPPPSRGTSVDCCLVRTAGRPSASTARHM